MCFHCAHTDNKGIGDLSIRFSLCDECCHFAFALGQAAKRFLVEAACRKGAGPRNPGARFLEKRCPPRLFGEICGKLFNQLESPGKGLLRLFMPAQVLRESGLEQPDTPEQRERTSSLR